MPGVFLWGWDGAGEKWIKVLVDTEGKVKTVAVIDNLDDIGDVNVPSPTDDDLLYWDAAAGKWKAKEVVGGYTEGAKVYMSADLSLSHNTITTVGYNSETYDTDTIHDNVTNNSRLTCKTAGKYLIIFIAGFYMNATGLRELSIRKNGVGIASKVENALDGDHHITQVVTIGVLAVNEYVESRALQSSGGDLNLMEVFTFFMMQRIG